MAWFGKKRDKPGVIDLRDEPVRKPARLEFGLPTPCPECGAHGYLDSIDIKERVMYQHCPSCFARWETTEAELLSA